LKQKIEIMQRNQPIGDLEFLAEQGYAAVPEALNDLPKLEKNLRTKSLSYQQKGYAFIFSLLIGAFLGITIFFGIHELATETPFIKKSQAGMQLPHESVDSTISIGAINEVPQDNFVNPEPTRSIEQSVEPNKLEAPTVEALPSVRMPEIPAQELTEQKLKFMVNSPIFYIQNLKVTNYTTLYFRKNKFIPSTGVSANYGSANESQLPREAPETWLHEKLADALKEYNKAHYLPCVVALDEVATHNDEDLNCDFYRGMSWYQMKNYAKALSFLEACITSSNNAFLQEAMFYKAMCMTEQGNYSAANKLFQQIVEEGEFYSEKAKAQLLKQAE
jgi:tetratricopeptide (TPR) repeat protein